MRVFVIGRPAPPPCVAVENPTGGPTCQMLQRWYRDPELPLHRTVGKTKRKVLVTRLTHMNSV